MKTEQWFPLIMAVLSLAAAVAYLIAGDLRRAVYWFCVFFITLVVTW